MLLRSEPEPSPQHPNLATAVVALDLLDGGVAAAQTTSEVSAPMRREA